MAVEPESGYLRRGVLAVAGLVCAAALGCAPAVPTGQAHRALSAAYDSAWVTGRAESALARLRRLAAGDPATAAAWERSWASTRVRSLERLLALPDSARAPLLATARPTPVSVSEDPGDWRELRAALERQAAARARWLGPGSPELAATRLALARIERTKGRRAQALAFDQQALAVVRAEDGDLPGLADCYLALGRDHKLGGVATGLPEAYTDSCLVLRRALFGEHSLEYTDALLVRANITRWLAHPREALRQFGQVLETRRRLLGRDAPGVAEVLGDMAVTHMRTADWRAVERCAGEAARILDKPGASASSARTLAVNMHGISLHRLGRLREAEPVLRRAAVLQEERRREGAGTEEAGGSYLPLTAYADLAAVQVGLGDSTGAWLSQERSLNRYWLEQAWRRGEVDSARTWEDLLARVQGKLSDSAAVIGFVDAVYQFGRVDQPFVAYVIRRRGPVRWVSMHARGAHPQVSTSDELSQLAKSLEVAAGWPFRVANPDELIPLERRAYAARFAALEPLLAGVRQLVVVSPSIDNSVPLEVFMDADGRTLDERFVISYSPSAVQWVWGAPPARPRADWRGLVVRAPGLASPGGSGDDLRAADREVSRVAAHLRSSLVLTGAKASEPRLRALERAGALERFDVIHIASHANAEVFGAHRTWLQLAGAEDTVTTATDSPDDGLLLSAEIASWRIPARLVTMASCRSGGTGYFQGEGRSGVGQAFQVAGARSVIVSLWPVDDDATQLLMGWFYDAAFPRTGPAPSIARALQLARLRLRDYTDSAGARPYRHPMYWGSFVLEGDPGEDVPGTGPHAAAARPERPAAAARGARPAAERR